MGHLAEHSDFTLAIQTAIAMEAGGPLVPLIDEGVQAVANGNMSFQQLLQKLVPQVASGSGMEASEKTSSSRYLEDSSEYEYWEEEEAREEEASRKLPGC